MAQHTYLSQTHPHMYLRGCFSALLRSLPSFDCSYSDINCSFSKTIGGVASRPVDLLCSRVVMSCHFGCVHIQVLRCALEYVFACLFFLLHNTHRYINVA